MTTIRNQIITAFVTKLNAKRALPFAKGDRLPLRSVWDLEEQAEKKTYSKHTSVIQVQVEVMLDASESDEGDLLDAALGSLQADAFADDETFDNLINSLAFTGATYSYSEDGSSIIGLSAGFEITYQFLTTDPTQQGD